MKRLFVLFLSLCLLLPLYSCTAREDPVSASTKTSTSAAAASSDAPTQQSPKTKDNSDTPPEEYAPLFWRVNDRDGNTAYLFGTIHVGDERSDTVMRQLEPFLSQCDALAVEFDSETYGKDLNAQIQMLSAFVYKDGTTIKDHIPAELYSRAVDVLKSAKIYNALFDYYQPAIWSQFIEQALLMKCDLSAEKAMDSLLLKSAHSSGKEILEVESASMQTDLLRSFPDAYYICSMRSDLNGIEESQDALKRLYEYWLSGEESGIENLLLTADAPTNDLTAEELQLIRDCNDRMLAKRNIDMAEKAKEYLQSGKTAFFAVGTAHFIGDGGIISLLKNEGYSVERIGF
ncbi:MAG: TraB/GumN family protein [Clostridia bacterium]|nr:TraB/GumN family protein [Clostridia bacterium]